MNRFKWILKKWLSWFLDLFTMTSKKVYKLPKIHNVSKTCHNQGQYGGILCAPAEVNIWVTQELPKWSVAAVYPDNQTNLPPTQTIPTNPRNDSAFELWPDAAHRAADQVAKPCAPRSGSRGTYWQGVAEHLERKRVHRADLMGKEDNWAFCKSPKWDPSTEYPPHKSIMRLNFFSCFTWTIAVF